jgi:hypothetical protein
MANDNTNKSHPIYIQRQRQWAKINAFYSGDKEQQKVYLVQNDLEDSRRFRARQNFTPSISLLWEIIEKWLNHLFAQGRPQYQLPAELQYLDNDIDGQGLSTRAFMNLIAKYLLLYGSAVIGGDMPQLNQPLQSKGEGAEIGALPRPCVISPINCPFWAADYNGLYELHLLDGLRRIIWRRDFFEIYIKQDDKYLLDYIGENALGLIPFKIITYPESLSGFENRGLGDYCIEGLIDIYNMLSALREMIFRQPFPQMVAQGSAEEYGNVQASDGAQIAAALGTYRIFLYPENRNPPQFIAPDPTSAAFLSEQIRYESQKIAYLSHLDALSAQQSSQVVAQSGVSKAFDFLNTNEALRAMGAIISTAFKLSMEFCAYWLSGGADKRAMLASGENAYNDTLAVFPSDFGVMSISEIEAEFRINQMYIGSSELAKLEIERLLSIMAPGISDDKKKMILQQAEEKYKALPSLESLMTAGSAVNVE